MDAARLGIIVDADGAVRQIRLTSAELAKLADGGRVAQGVLKGVVPKEIVPPATVPSINRVTEAIQRMKREAGSSAMASQIAKLDPFQQQVASAAKATEGLGKFQNQLGNVAISLAGLPGPLGRLAGSMSQFLIGGGLMVGVLAALAAVSFAWQKIGEEARKAKERQDEAIASLREASRMEGFGPGGRTVGDVAEAQARVDANRRRLAELEGERQAAISRSGLAPGTSMMGAERRAQVEKEVAEIVKLISDGERRINEALKKSSHERADIMTRDLAVLISTNRATAAERKNALALLKGLEDSLAAMTRSNPAATGARSALAEQIRMLKEALFPVQELRVAVNGLADEWQRAFDSTFRSKMEEFKGLVGAQQTGENRISDLRAEYMAIGKSEEAIARLNIQRQFERDMLAASREEYRSVQRQREADAKAVRNQALANLQLAEAIKRANEAASKITPVFPKVPNLVGGNKTKGSGMGGNTGSMVDWLQFGMSFMPRNATTGAIGGALSGFMAGNMLMPGVGGAAGAFAGLAGAILGAGAAARKSAEDLRKLREAVAKSVDEYRAEANGTATDLSRAIAEEKRRADALRKEVEAATPYIRMIGERIERLQEIDEMEAKRIQQLKDEAAAIERATAERIASYNRDLQVDLRIRRLRAEGLNMEADAIALATQHERDRAQAMKDGANEATIAAMDLVHALERQKLASEAAAEQAQRHAEQHEATQRKFEDLHIRYLDAMGLGSESVSMAAAHRREMAEAIAEGWSKQEQAMLSVVQSLERNALAARQAAEAQIAVIEKQTAETLKRLDDQRAAVAEQIKTSQTQERTLEASINGLRGVLDGLAGFKQSMAFSDLSALSPMQQLASARGLFEAARAASLGGDTTAAGQIPELGRLFLERSRSVNASGAGFQSDNAFVRQTVDELIAKFGTQLTTEEKLLEEAKKHTASLEQQIVELERQRAAAEEQARRAIDELRSQSYLQRQTIDGVIAELKAQRDGQLIAADKSLTSLDEMRNRITGLGAEINDASFRMVQETRNAFVNASNAEIDAIQRGASVAEIAQLRQVRELEQQRLDNARTSSEQINQLAAIHGFNSVAVQEAIRTRNQLDSSLRDQINATNGVRESFRNFQFIPLPPPIPVQPMNPAEFSAPIVSAAERTTARVGDAVAQLTAQVGVMQVGFTGIISGLSALRSAQSTQTVTATPPPVTTVVEAAA